MVTIKSFIKRVIRKILAVSVSLFLDPIAWAIAKAVPQNRSYQAFSKYGMHLLAHHYYLPIPDETDMAFTRDSELVGVTIDDQKVFDTLENVIQPYKPEFTAFPMHDTGNPKQFYIVNGAYMAIDGNVYYGLIRHYKPRRIVEIGSGRSTLLAAEAIRKNKAEGGQVSEIICIEPFPSESLKQIPEVTELIVKRVQEVDLDFFTSLQSGDILFIDSTHALRSGGDVWWEYCEILPRLQPGVLVHIHDVSLPKPYPRVYYDQQLYWNEQYLLQAFLTYNSRFEVVWPGNYMLTKYPDRIKAAFNPEYDQMRAKYPSSEATAFWMRVL